MSRETVDFLLVGAQKCATTSLAKYLSAHPEIYMPIQKEISFFSTDRKYELGFEHYLTEYFSQASESHVWGEASVTYLRYGFVAERIAEHLPHAKILAILRDPVERAYSHYRMAVREGHEDRSFEKCVEDLLRRGRVADHCMQQTIGQSLEYVMSGEYGRLLETYFLRFPKENIRVVFFEDLSRHPSIVMQKIFEWLCVSSDFQSTLFHRKFHVGGKQYIRSLDRKLIGVSSWIRQFPRAWKLLYQRLPRQQLLQFLFWLRTEANLRGRSASDKLEMPESTRKALMAHYGPDVSKLSNVIGVVPPWPWYVQSTASDEFTTVVSEAA